eukprot:Skav205359  [mRNA]  locus=scaffold1956:215191:216555:- [translate_table: standard]
MLRPVDQLSDDETAAVPVLKKPAANAKPKGESPAPRKTKEPQTSPATKEKKTSPAPKEPKAKGNSAFKRPAARASGPQEPDPTPKKKPATRDRSPKGPSICHYKYKQTGVWGFKIDGKQKLRDAMLAAATADAINADAAEDLGDVVGAEEGEEEDPEADEETS